MDDFHILPVEQGWQDTIRFKGEGHRCSILKRLVSNCIPMPPIRKLRQWSPPLTLGILVSVFTMWQSSKGLPTKRLKEIKWFINWLSGKIWCFNPIFLFFSCMSITQTYMFPYGHVLTHMVPYFLYGLYGPVWSSLVQYGPKWSCMALHGLVWNCMVLHSPA